MIAPKIGPALWLSLEGRASRKTLWLYYLVPISAVALLAAAVDGMMGATGPNRYGP